MKITEFAKRVTAKEGLREETSIAQVLEILLVINKLTGGVFYGIIKLMK